MNNNDKGAMESDSKATGGKKQWVKPELSVLGAEGTNGKPGPQPTESATSIGPS